MSKAKKKPYKKRKPKPNSNYQVNKNASKNPSKTKNTQTPIPSPNIKLDMKEVRREHRKAMILSAIGILLLCVVVAIVCHKKPDTSAKDVSTTISTTETTTKSAPTTTKTTIKEKTKATTKATTKTTTKATTDKPSIMKDSLMLSDLKSTKNIDFEKTYYINLNSHQPIQPSNPQRYSNFLMKPSGLEDDYKHECLSYRLQSNETIYIYIPEEYTDNHQFKDNAYFSGTFERITAGNKSVYV